MYIYYWVTTSGGMSIYGVEGPHKAPATELGVIDCTASNCELGLGMEVALFWWGKGQAFKLGLYDVYYTR